MIIRLSNKLAKKIKETDASSLPADPNPFADWSARLFTVERVQYILVSNTASLYSMVFYGRGVTDDNRLIHEITDSMRDVMEHDGFRDAYERQVAPQAARIRFAKALNRSATGSMNQLAFYAEIHLIGGEVSPFDVSFRLNDTLMSYGKEYHRPKEVFGFAAQGL